MAGPAGRSVGLGLVYELAKSPAACTSAAAAVSAAILYRPVALCSESTSVDPQYSTWPYDRPTHEADSTVGSGPAHLEHAANSSLHKFELKTIWSVYTPYNLTFTAFRSAFFNLLPIWNEYFRQVEAAEEAAFTQGREPLEEWPPFPKEQLRPALDRSVWMSLRDLATLTVRRVYERIAVERCSLPTTTKLLKDARKSIVRKTYLPWHKRLYRIPRTCFRANILGAAADCTVSVVVDTYRVIYLPAHKGEVRRTRSTVLRRFLRIVAADAFRCSSCLVVASIGAGLGAWLFQPVNRPGVGSFVGASAAEFGFTLFVVAPLVNDWAYGPDDHPPLIPAEPEQLEGEQAPVPFEAAGYNADERLPGGEGPEHLEGQCPPRSSQGAGNNTVVQLPGGD